MITNVGSALRLTTLVLALAFGPVVATFAAWLARLPVSP
jgi:hypothetical protein